MDAVILSNSTLFFRKSPIRQHSSSNHIPKLLTTTTALTASSKNQFLFRSQTTNKLSLASTTNAASAIPRFIVTCAAASGRITEINQTQFPNTVLKSDRPVLVEFVANWCGPCRLIAPAMESIAQEYGDRLVVVKIDHDANPQLIEEYKVYGLPTLILFKGGKEVPESRREGAITKVKLKEYLDSLLESISIT